jgi:hypothetical chaperone protein
MKGIGIDFGTSNSAIAVFDGTELRMIEIEPGARTVPTAIHLDRDFQPLTGSVAIKSYVEENSDRRVEITAKVIAEINVDMEDSEGESLKIYGAAEDHGLPGRLFLGIKRLLGKQSIIRLMVFDRPFRLVALITPILLSFRHAINTAIGRVELVNVEHGIYMGRPVEFEGNESGKNSLATDRIQESSGYAELGPVTFYPEPVAACLSFVTNQKIDDGSTVLTVDFGGGTLDLCLVHYRDDQFQVLGTEGIAIGGDYIDQLIFEKLIFPELGKGVQWSRTVDGALVTTPFPFDEYENALLNWTITHTLNQNQFTGKIAQYLNQNKDKPGAETEKLQRLEDVIHHNYSYSIFQHIKAAKIALSEAHSTELDIPELNLTLPLTRQQLNVIIGEVIESLQSCIDQLLTNTNTDPSTINFVMRTGGSSRIAAVVELLESLFPGKVVQHDTFTSVASGLAIASYYGYECKV